MTSKLSSKGSDTISKRARLLDTNFYPTMFFTEGCLTSFSNLHSRISSMMASPFITSAHPSWKMACTESLILCKLEVQQAPCEAEAMCGLVGMSWNINP